jgi:dephospho-CoA kinase
VAALRVQVVYGADADEVASRLREHDRTGLLAVTVGDRPGLAAVVIAAPHSRIDERAADVILDAGQPLAEQADRLWVDRLGPFARAMVGSTTAKPGPPVLHDHDPRLLAAAQRLLGRLRDGLTKDGLDDGRWTYDHIGSTAVPGLQAKRFIDLQLGVVSLPEEGSPADQVLVAAGFVPAIGARLDSPGVYWDGVKNPDLAPAEAYRKRLYLRPDPAQLAILHVRHLGAPWWSYTVRFRDWLRANPAGRQGYERAKQRAAAAHARDADFDDYTRAKGAFFDQVQAEYEQCPPYSDTPGRPRTS